MTEESRPSRIAVSSFQVDPKDCFLYHKTTLRGRYERARAAFPEYDDVILTNTANEVTETTIGNLVFFLRGNLCTPPLFSGLLPGVFRAKLLSEGIIREETVTLEQALAAETVYRINSVRGWEKAVIELSE